MTQRHDSLMVHYAEGRGNLGKATNRILGWAEFCKQFSRATVTKERREVFDGLTKEEQDKLKSVDGWIIGAQVKDGIRQRKNVQPRDLLSLDYDHSTALFIDQIATGLTPLSDNEFFVHTTRRHTDEKPRIRFFAPLSKPVDPEDYSSLSRILAFMMEGANPMPMVDMVSFRVAQMMFRPTRSIDGDWWHYRNKGELLDPDAIFAWFEKNHGDRNDFTILPRAAGESDLRESADKAEDPTEKKGPVGNFCRAYDVIAAIDKFLPDCYAAADDFSNKPRYTYLLGTSTSGAVVEDSGLFLFSHHGSDPCADMLVNAFDLVRIHLFGDLDEDEKDTPINKRPSYKKMVEFIADDENYRRAQAESKYDITAMFEDVLDDDLDPEEPEPDSAPVDDEDDEAVDLLGFDDDAADDAAVRRLLGSGAGSPADMPPAPRPAKVAKPKREKPPEGWFPDDLTLDQNGAIMSSVENASIIVHNDPRLFRGIAYNEHSNQIVCRRTIQSKLAIAPSFICRDTVNGDRWQDANDITIRILLEASSGPGKIGYGLKMTDRNLSAAIFSAAHRNAFHPVKEYLAACEWDGKSRIDTLLIRYLGVPDTTYYRETIRLKMIASVARIMAPGCKFDYAIIMHGDQGIRKSSFIKALYSDEWFGEIDCKLDNKQEIAETIGGTWVNELPELAGFHKSDHNSAKQFMRRQFDDVRMAYDRRVSEFPRQCVFWGTTNDDKFLRDPTGNRSYWPCPVLVPMIDTDGVIAERDQLWGEAVALYNQMRAATTSGRDLPLTLSLAAIAEAQEFQEEARTMELHEMWAEKISEWAGTPVTLTALLQDFGIDMATATFRDEGDLPGNTMVLRAAFTREQASTLGLDRDRGVGDYQTAQNIERALLLVKEFVRPKKVGVKGTKETYVMGRKGRWYLRADASHNERKQGFRVCLSASSGESPDDDFSHLI